MATQSKPQAGAVLNSADRLISRRTLAERWELSVETLKRRERSGILRSLKLGRGVRYRLSDIERIEADADVRHSSAMTGGAAA
jgi:hypothetical protein